MTVDLCNGNATFQRTTDSLLVNATDIFALFIRRMNSYIFVLSECFKNQLEHLEAVVDCMSDAGAVNKCILLEG